MYRQGVEKIGPVDPSGEGCAQDVQRALQRLHAMTAEKILQDNVSVRDDYRRSSSGMNHIYSIPPQISAQGPWRERMVMSMLLDSNPSLDGLIEFGYVLTWNSGRLFGEPSSHPKYSEDSNLVLLPPLLKDELAVEFQIVRARISRQGVFEIAFRESRITSTDEIARRHLVITPQTLPSQIDDPYAQEAMDIIESCLTHYINKHSRA